METRSANMGGKVVLVTGGTGGIGRATAEGLARMGATVVVTGRDRERGEAAVAEIRRGSGNPKVGPMLADLSSLAEVRRLAEEFAAGHDRLDVLVNNVGHLSPERRETADGFEATLATNVLGPFLITGLLLPLLEKSAPARIVNVSGGMPAGRLDFDDFQAERKYGPFGAYSRSKLANLLWTFELARRLEGTGVGVFAVYPGSADTAMTRSMDAPLPVRVLGTVVRTLGLFGGPPEKAAVSSIRAAGDPALGGATGRYLKPGGKEGDPPRGSTDGAAGERLRAVCERLTGLSDRERKLERAVEE